MIFITKICFAMKNFVSIKSLTVPVALALLAAAMPSFTSCDKAGGDQVLVAPQPSSPALSAAPEPVARLLSELPLSLDQVREVHDGVLASSSNGFDEEYPFSVMVSSPGCGVGDGLAGTRAAGDYPVPLKDLLSAASGPSTRASAFLDDLASSGLQIYWPYSDTWDGESLPAITFCPDVPQDSNVGFMREQLPDGSWIVKEIEVDEDFARSHPVWVVNMNDDADAMTPQLLSKLGPASSNPASLCSSGSPVTTRATSDFKTLRLKEFKAHRQYDPWLCGGSEFFVKCGSIKAFTAAVVSDLQQYSPEITDLMIKVKRSQVGKSLRYNSILVSDWSSQLTECAFLMTEDDGGKMTSWKSTGKVTIKSKSYGFEVEIPYHRNDDIVWRGKLSYNYLEANNGIANRYGDVSVTFTFD